MSYARKIDLDINCSSVVIVISYSNNNVVWGEEVGDGCAPFDDDDVIGICEVFGEIFGHESGILETIEIIMDEIAFAVW